MLTKIDKMDSGYQLYDLGYSLWKIEGSFGSFIGNLNQVSVYSVHVLDFEFEEIETAVLEMDSHFHNCSEFGVFKKFMWTFDKEERYDKVSGN